MTNKGKFTPLIISLGIGFGIMAVVFVIKVAIGGAEVFEYPRTLMSIFTDCAFVSGVMLISVGGLIFSTREGIFDGIGFAFESFFVVRNWSPTRRFKDRETFSEYRDRKAEKRKEKKGVSHFFISGGFYLLLSIIFLIIYSAI